MVLANSKGDIMNRWTQCILPDSVHGISFDQDGVCNFCQTYTPPELLGEEQLLQVFESMKPKYVGYDCIVPLSGGRDSTFVLYQAVRRYGLVVLAVSYDNEFQIPSAHQNVARACEILNVKLIRKRSDRDTAHKVVKEGLLYNGGICSACTYGYKSSVYAAAQEYKIPLIIWGSSAVENTARMRSVFAATEANGNQVFTKITRRLKTWTNPYSLRAKYNMFKLSNEIPVQGNAFWQMNNVSIDPAQIREISLFDYIEWNRQDIVNTIITELGWQKPDDRTSTWRADCYLHSFENWKFIQKHGCTKDAFGYCNMINAGHLTRDEALLREEEMLQRIFDLAMDSMLTERVGLKPVQARKVMRRYSA